MELSNFRVPKEKLRWQCDPSILGFESTKDLQPLRQFIGQERAIKAIEFGLSMEYDGYNIYVAGLTGTGKTSAVKAHINKLLEEKQAREQFKPLFDWCYLYQFSDPDRPTALRVPQGKGKMLRDQLNELLQNLKDELAKAFSSPEYKEQRKAIVDDNQVEQRKILDKLREDTLKKGFVVQITPLGPTIIPVKDGKPLTQEEYMSLNEGKRKDIETRQNEILKEVESSYETAREYERKMVQKLQEIDKSIADATVTRLFLRISEQYKEFADITKFLNDLKTYTLDNLEMFKVKEEPEPPPGLLPGILQGRDPFLPFRVNIFVDNSETQGPPVVVETNPTYTNLFGKIERRFLFGGYLSDHTMLKPGALHVANGGYLLLNAVDVLSNPAVWPALKRAIKTKQLGIEEPFEQLGLFAPMGLKPAPVPIDVKILLIGDVSLYQLLSFYDEDFWEIFKVKADFDYKLDKNKENMMYFAAVISACCERIPLLHFHKTGVAKALEYAARMVEDQEKLSSRFAQITELAQESEYFARKDNSTLVYGKHVDKAIEERLYRHNLPDEHIREMIERNMIMVDTSGAVVGQINGLSVYSLGDISFGKPSRITCKTFLGRGGVINIERESQLSGRIHDKGVLILSGYVGWKYAQDYPLSLSASLCFEQSYEGVEGDSASSAEIYALLSSLSDIPIKQNFAVTGSVNQKGEIQPIGGVNQKIEGFFQICNSRGLTGDQGVVIPYQNVTNLMLKDEVIDAINAGKFNIYAVKTIDEGIEILTGVEAGTKTTDGKYPEDSVNYLVDAKLQKMATKLKEFYEEKPESHKEKKSP